MHRSSRPDGLHLDTSDQTPSGVIDRTSMSPSFSLLSIPSVNPEPAYIAPASAANLVTSELAGEFDLNPSEGVSVSSGSLSLINAFLDRLLFNFLTYARSTSLVSLRPAVVEVLKPKLAKQAIVGADEELQEYLGTDDELETFHNGEEPSADWDLDAIWKRARLRCMLYTRLGDMEEGDEEMYLAQEGLSDADGRPPRDISMVTPPVAIFLTSVLEFVGEHALLVAVRAAYKRTDARSRAEARELESVQKIVVEEVDMEKVALDPTLGRLWRTWRKDLRSPRNSLSRISRELVGQRGVRPFSVGSISRRSSVATADSQQLAIDPDHVPSVGEVLDGPDPSLIPLPSTDHDVSEIEVPGYSSELALRNKSTTRKSPQGRPISMPMAALSTQQAPSSLSPLAETTPSSEASTPRQQLIEDPPAILRRSQSLPTPHTPFFAALEYPETDLPPGTPLDEPVQDQEPEAKRISIAARERMNDRESILQKPYSAPSTPHPGSVLQGILKSVERPFILGEDGTYYDDGPDDLSDNDPAEGALQFDQNDYKIDDNERVTEQQTVVSYPSSQRPPKPPAIPYSPSNDLRTSPEPGEISPVGHASIRSGEVSPIEPSDDELPTHPKVAAPSKSNDPEIYTGVGYRPHVGHGRSPPAQPKLVDYGSRVPQPSRQRRKVGPTEDDYAKEEKREAFVVPEDADAKAPRPVSDSSSLSGKDLQADGTILNKRLRNMVPEVNGAPNLGPLREMLEAAHDTSDEASSLATSQADYAPRATSTSSSNAKGIATSKPADLRRQLPTAQATPALDRAAVQRISPVAKRDTASTRQSRSSEGSFRDSRGVSIASAARPLSVKGKGRGSSLSGDHYRDSLPSRTSSDGSRNAYDEKYGSDANDRQRSFEQLMNSGETIQYTLTPQNMREIEGQDAQVVPAIAAPSKPFAASRGGRASLDRTSPKQSRIVPNSSLVRAQLAASPPASRASDFVIHSGPPVKRGPRPVPREPTVKPDDTGDFADFIRSTGPESIVAAQKSVSVASLPRSARSATLKGKPRLQAREPTTRNTKSNDLIEFIKQGPPSDRNSAGSRVARNMASARTTADSDEMSSSAHGRLRDSHSVASTQDSFMAKSIQSSTNSQTGLLESARNASKRSAQNNDDDGAPVRTRRRVKDPYAIPDSDDEDEELPPTPKARDEESLMDFLNSVPPPHVNNSPPPLDIPKSAAKSLQRKANGPSMRSRFASGSNEPSDVAHDLSRPGAGRSTPIKTPYNDGPFKQASSARSPYVPRSPPQHSNGLAGENNRPNGMRPVQRQMKARNEREDTSIGDLADFLKNSGPPEMPPSFAASSPIKEKEEGGFSRMFSRKKSKSAAIG